MTDRCYICGEDNPNVLQTHHIIPRRYGGEDRPQNLVRLCANCHQAIESIYDDLFFDRVVSWGQEWDEAGQTLRDAVSSFIENELNVTSEGHIYIPTRGDEQRQEMYEDYLEFCENRRLPVHTSQMKFFQSVDKLAPEGTVETV
jgi:hypothetical protein